MGVCIDPHGCMLYSLGALHAHIAYIYTHLYVYIDICIATDMLVKKSVYLANVPCITCPDF